MYNKQLDTFVKAAECGSFSKAADVLYITPSAVIQQIKNLETDLRVKLFDRTNHGIKLTEAGEYLLAESRILISKSAEIRTALQTIAGKNNVTLTIGINTYHTPKMLYEQWFRFDMKYPGYEVNTVHFGDIAPKQLENIDIVEGVLFKEPWHQDFDFIYLDETPLVLSVPKSNPLSEKKLLGFNDISELPVVVIKKGLDDVIDKACDELDKKGVKLIPVDIYDTSAILMCITRGYALLMPECYGNVNMHLKIVAFDWDYKMKYGFFIAKNRSSALKRFAEFIG